MLKAKTRWRICEQDEEKAQRLASNLEISPFLAQLLINRDLDTVEKAKPFLHTDKQSFYDPFLLDGMEQAVKRIHEAISNQEKILVFGDYDADGVSSTSLLVRVLRRLHAIVDYYIPNRFTEGYGPNISALESAKANGVSLVITVDTGIAAIDAALAAKQMHLDYIVTDHHEPGPSLPDAFAIINPKKSGCPYPFKSLAGVGVAFKLCHALLGEAPLDLLDIAALGTVADLVPLIDENRLIVTKGLRCIQHTDKQGLLSLIEVAGIDTNQLNADHIGFSIGPRLNAAGRMGHAKPAVELLLTEDMEEAMAFSHQLDQANQDRKALVDDIANQAAVTAEAQLSQGNKILVISGVKWHAGVIGIVASRIVERFYRPTIVLSIDPEEGLAKGSARSIDGFDIFQALSTCRDLLPHFGGHPMAAGMTLIESNLNELNRRLNEYAQNHLADDLLKPLLSVDYACHVNEVNIELIEELEQLSPYGVGNPKPKIMIKKAAIGSMKQIGAAKNHLKLTLEKEESQLEAVGFNRGEDYYEIAPRAEFIAVGELSINEWNGFRKPQFLLEDRMIPDWQLFDLRGRKDLYHHLVRLPQEKRRLISFQNQENSWNLHELDHEVLMAENISSGELNHAFVVLLDIPESEEKIRVFFKNHPFPERIYAVFNTDEDHFFSTLPNHSDFKWLYALLHKQGSFPYELMLQKVSQHKGWSRDTVIFMIKVFSELGFVTIENGQVLIEKNPNKKPLTESKAYQMKKDRIQLESLLCYSSYQDLKNWFQHFNLKRTTPEEAMVK